MKYADISQYLTNNANYRVNVSLTYLDSTIQNYIDKDGLIMMNLFA